MVKILCMKWGDKYGPDYVNVLRRMVSRHLSLPHRFVCLTDNDQGIGSDIETRPIADLGLPRGTPERGWNKLAIFEGQVGDLSGPALFLDLDVLIVDDIDCFFEHPGDYCIIKNWPPPVKTTGNSSVFRFELGKSPHIHRQFITNQDALRKRFRNDQEYLTHAFGESGNLSFWPDTWCRSFKRHCIPKGPLRYFTEPKLPADTKILVFHGLPKPSDAITGNKSVRHFTRPAPWVGNYWF